MRVLVCACVCLGAIVGSVATASAQDASKASVGLKVGGTAASLAVTGSPLAPERKVGILGGGFVTIGAGTVRVQPEVVLATKNFSSASPVGTIDVSSRTIDVPVLVVARLHKPGRVHPLIMAGPYLSLLSKVTQTVAGVDTDLDDQLKDSDAGVVVGLGLDIDLSRGGMIIDARYAHGLKNLSMTSSTTYKSRTFSASIGYRF